MLDVAQALDDLRSPPGNRLEALKGDQRGRHSIRVDEQFRVTFRWEENHAHEVRCEDYHS
jgi:proteic killer suppression protein